jgi:sulfur-oxidizing protein SoxX
MQPKADRTTVLAGAGLLTAVLAVSPLAAEDLVSVRIANGAIDEPLTTSPGNPGRGRQIVRDMDRATCLVCHVMPIPEEPDHGAIGPSLVGVGSRFTPGQLRLRLVDPKALNPSTIMPSYYRIDGLYRVLASYRGKPIYTAQEIEDVVAYLASLKGSQP